MSFYSKPAPRRHAACLFRSFLQRNAAKTKPALWTLLLCGLALPGVARASSSTSDDLLPNAPSSALHLDASAPYAQEYTKKGPVAPITTMNIPAGEQAQPLNVRQKMNVTLHDIYTPESFLGFVVAGGYSQLVHGQPNYGTGAGAFGQRVGASAARDTSEEVFQGIVFAPLLHEDPRYYREGDSYSFVHRVAYSITRPLITRGDNGHQRINASLLLGYAAAAGLTAAYYPQSNRDLHDVASTFGSSIGGAAVGFAFQEFVGDATRFIHRHHSHDSENQ